MSDVDPVATAEAEVAKAEADLAAAEAAKADMVSEGGPAPAEQDTVRIATKSPWTTYTTDDGEVITFSGSDVPATLAEKLLAAVPGVLRKVDSAG